MSAPPERPRGPIAGVIRFCLEQKLVVALLLLAVGGAGVLFAPFDWDVDWVERRPVPVDAIPDIGKNQQIVFTEWMGRSPQDVEDQVTYPLTVALLGIPGVETVRSYSFFGFSSIYVIFSEDVEFYWSRSRVLEKLSSLPAGTLPDGVQPALGPDATALGQVFWYTLEGRDPDGNPTGGWGLDELRSVQDWYVRYALLSADGVSEVASVGGFVREYQIDVDPDAMNAHGVTLNEVVDAVRSSNLDVGARTFEVNSVEYVVRGLGFVEALEDLEQVVVRVRDNVPIRVADVARLKLGPSLRRGVLDKAGAEVVGGVVVVRYGANPLATIESVKAEIERISPGLPRKVVIDWSATTPEEARAFAAEEGFRAYRAGAELDQDAWTTWAARQGADLPGWLTLSQLEVVPFYDRSGLIHETLGTLETALIEEVLISVIVVIAMLLHLRSSLLISGLLPLAVLVCFIAMKGFGVDANVVALSGIAIAIGTMVDMGIILSENILRHLDEAGPDDSRLEVVHRAASEVGGAVVTAVFTTVVSFLPVFTMEAAEGKLFRPLAFTKTFALLGSILVALTIIPPVAHLVFSKPGERRVWLRRVGPVVLVAVGLLGLWLKALVGLAIVALAALSFAEGLARTRWPRVARYLPWAANALAAAVVAWFLTERWLPLGPDAGTLRNLVFVVGLIGGVLGFFQLFQRAYPALLRWCLDHKLLFLALPALLLAVGLSVWLGFATVFAWVPASLRPQALEDAFPGLGEEFMPPLDEGSFLYMPTTMPHASIGEAHDVLRKLDMAMAQVPEVDEVVGKIGRVDSPLDPAPVSMVETVVTYVPEYATGEGGRRLRFAYDPETGEHLRDPDGELIPDPDGIPLRQWREHIRTPDDIWDELVDAARVPGTTSAPKLQPIAARIVMLQSGMRAPMGVKIKGPDLDTIEQVALDVERILKEVPGVKAQAVVADRVVGKPYLEIDIDRAAIARHGLKIAQVQDVIEVAIGGRALTTTVEGRERYPVRVRYARELRDTPEAIDEIYVPTPDGHQIPLGDLAELRYARGPQVVKSEDTRLVAYVIFDKEPGVAEVDVVEAADAYLKEKRAAGELLVPEGVDWEFAGSYRNQVRAEKRLRVILPLALFVIFIILYLQFGRVSTTLFVFTGIAVAWSGGFLMIWLYGQPWFLDFELLGADFRTLFQVQEINLSVAIWVGFLALFGIATDDGVVIATYLDQSFARNPTTDRAGIRAATVEAGERRIRPCLMTTATTILALVPVLTSTGRGADIMVPMAIPSFGGMCVALVTLFVVPVLYCGWAELRQAAGGEDAAATDAAGAG